MDIVDYANEIPPSSRIGTLAGYLKEEDVDSPIDMYLRGISAILGYGDQVALSKSEFLGRLLLVGVVSTAEAYFRSVLSSCIEMCPVCQTVAAKQTINLGGLLWHGPTGFSRSAFEHASFTSQDELTSACKKYLGIALDDQSFKSPLEQFEIVCQLRHGIVHNDGLLPGRNAVLLDVPRYRKPARITIRYEHLQEAAAVVSTLVLTLNRLLFSTMCKRWAIDWRQRADWDPGLEASIFGAIWKLFHSVEETKRRKGRSKITKANCMAAVKTLYNL